MIRSAGTIKRACELVAAALIWNHDVSVAITRSAKAARPSYTVSIVPRPGDGTTGPDPAGDE